MGKTKIEWTWRQRPDGKWAIGYSFNGWWGCAKKSPGCENCYAEAFDHRVGGEHWGPKAPRRFFGDAHWDEPFKWNRQAAAAGERRIVFGMSFADWLEARPDLIAPRRRFLGLIAKTPHFDWMLLTKRPENFVSLISEVAEGRGRSLLEDGDAAQRLAQNWLENHPPENVWVGATVEDVPRKDRLDLVREIPAHTRFISFEPLLEDLGELDLRGIHMAIVGGESGPGARIFDFAHARQIRQQCEAQGVAFFMKQGGAVAIDSDYSLAPLDLSGKKGGKLEEFPEDLQIREFPKTLM